MTETTNTRRPLDASAWRDMGTSVHVRAAFTLRAVLDFRPLAISLVSAMIGHLAAADTAFRHEMVTAFGEAFNNIVIHGYKGRSDGVLEVVADFGTNEMTLTLIDTGNAVDFGSLTPPDLDSLPEGGMGVFMIHALVDEVVYADGSPNVLSLMKRTSSASPKEAESRDELRPHG